MDLVGMPPAYRATPGLVTIHPWTYEASTGAPGYGGCFVGAASGAWPAANVGIFVPFSIPEPTTFTKLWFCNGSAAGDSWDVGLFGEDGTMLVAAGTTTGTNNSAPNVVDITDTTLARGRYYLGVTHSGTTANRAFGAAPAAGILQACGVVEDSSCAPPFSTNANPATFVAFTRAWLPLAGAQGYRTLGP